MMRLVTLIIFIVAAYLIFRYLTRMLTQGVRRPEEGRNSPYQNWQYASREEEYRKILGVTDRDGPETIRAKYKELLTKYHPDKVQHLGIDLGLCFRRTS